MCIRFRVSHAAAGSASTQAAAREAVALGISLTSGTTSTEHSSTGGLTLTVVHSASTRGFQSQIQSLLDWTTAETTRLHRARRDFWAEIKEGVILCIFCSQQRSRYGEDQRGATTSSSTRCSGLASKLGETASIRQMQAFFALPEERAVYATVERRPSLPGWSLQAQINDPW